MDTSSGDIRMFDSDEEAKKQGYDMPLKKGEVVKIKEGYFRITGIDTVGNTIALKAMSTLDALCELERQTKEHP